MKEMPGYNIWEEQMELMMEALPVAPNPLLIACASAMRHMIDDEIELVVHDQLFNDLYAVVTQEIAGRGLTEQWNTYYREHRPNAVIEIGPNPMGQVIRHWN